MIENLVARHDDRLQSFFGDSFGQRADDIVGLVACQFDDGNVEGFQNLTDATHSRVEILLERLIQLLTRRLVVFVDLVPKRLVAAGVKNEA